MTKRQQEQLAIHRMAAAGKLPRYAAWYTTGGTHGHSTDMVDSYNTVQDAKNAIAAHLAASFPYLVATGDASVQWGKTWDLEAGTRCWGRHEAAGLHFGIRSI